MLNRFIYLSCLVVAALGIVAVEFPKGLVGISIAALMAVVIVFAIRRFADEKEFLTSVFLAALALRLAFGIFIEIFDLRLFFGSDAVGYHNAAIQLVDEWMGKAELGSTLRFQSYETSASFWGIYYLVASIYFLLGPNIFAAQCLVATIGAATGPMVFFCSKEIFGNLRVAKFAAVSIAVFPSFIVWSAQLLKDGLIVFLLVTSMIMVLRLQKKLSYPAVAILVFSLLGILSLRFYVFYMAIIAVGGSFLVGLSKTNISILRNVGVVLLLGFGLVYFGAGERGVRELEVFGNLERIQISRLDLATSAESGFGAGEDVSTAGGALSALPLGFTYLMLAPFPWEATNLRQAITIPEVLIWWAALPFLFLGLVYALKNRLRSAFPILVFCCLLTAAYSIGQGNVGTAYRQRTQIQVFLFILIGVGWTVYKEKKENERLIRQAAQRQVDERLRAGRLVIQK